MTDPRLPAFESFAAAAQRGNIIATSVTMTFDHETAITLADRFLAEPYFFLLESAAPGPGSMARYSYIGFEPLWRWATDGVTATLSARGETKSEHLAGLDPVRALRKLMAQYQMSACAGSGGWRGPQLADGGGAVGYFGYDVAMRLEPHGGPTPEKRLGLPEAHFFLPRRLLVLDHLMRRLTVIGYALIEKGETETELRAIYGRECQDLTALLKRLETEHRPPSLAISESPLDFDRMTASFDRATFLQQVERCQDAIRAGDVYQIQIGNRLSLPLKARPFDVFRHLRILNPSPYMFYYRFAEHVILGASPELMVGVQGRTVIHRPIAGTRKRTWEKKADARMREELKSSEKERAEHVMLVDLSRNDIGRVAAPGTVRVEELMVVEEYSHVFHLVSQVSGTLAAGLDAYEAMAASFPNGTVSGAPKIRAMELINELEPCAREFYAGSLGVFDFKGDLKSTLLIRSLHIANGIASTQASAGIVYDSVPAHEWQETRNKMAACLIAMQNTQ